MNKDNVFDKLFQVFVEEIAAYNYLVETMELKQKALVKNDIKGIQLHTSTEQMVINKANALADLRRQLMQEVLAQEGHKNAQADLIDFFQRFRLDSQPQWLRLYKRLTGAAEKIRRLNFENSELIEASMYFVQNMIRLFYPKDEAAAQIYTRTGAEQDSLKTNLLDYNV